jgi:hypothetical protein
VCVEVVGSDSLEGNRSSLLGLSRCSGRLSLGGTLVEWIHAVPHEAVERCCGLAGVGE